MSTELSPAGLTKEDLRRYQADGYLVIRNLFTTEEIAALESEAKDLIEREELIDTGNIRCRWQSDVTSITANSMHGSSSGTRNTAKLACGSSKKRSR